MVVVYSALAVAALYLLARRMLNPGFSLFAAALSLSAARTALKITPHRASVASQTRPSAAVRTTGMRSRLAMKTGPR